MIHNPELRRNIWLDFSLHRIIFTPLIIGLLAYLFKLMSDSAGASLMFYLACFFLFIWGTLSASSTVTQEVNNNTWDFQRQSAISPWSMTIGKLLGSTLFCWYGATISLGFLLILQLPLPAKEWVSSNQIFTLIIGGLFSQALALLSSLQILPKIRHQHSKTFSYSVVAGLIGIFFTMYCYMVQSSKGSVLWHHQQFNAAAFFLISYMIFLGWTIIGLYRSFSKELQYQNIPWVWLAFNLYCMVYFSGFGSFFIEGNQFLNETPDIRSLLETTPFYIAFSVITLLCYMALFTDSLTSMRYRKILTRISENNFTETLQELPWWVVSFALAIIVGIFTSVLPNKFEGNLKDFSVPIFILTIMLFLVRDILLAHYFYLSKNPGRAQAAVILYLSLLWIAVPSLISLMGFNHLLPAFLPSYGDNTLLALVAILAQIGFFGFLVWNRWESIWAPEEAPKIITLGE